MLQKAKKALGGSGWVAVGLLGLTTVSGTAAGCGASFESCTETRTCAPEAEDAGGAGGEPTMRANAGASGSSGGAAGEAPTACGADETPCGVECVDVNVDVDHCGSCTTACADNAVCEAGSCRACPNGQLGCDGECVDPLADVTFCGATGRCLGADRGVACTAGDLCQAGACVSDSAALRSLSLAPATLSPEFGDKTLAYEASFPFYTQHLTLQAVPASEKATVTAGGVPVGSEGTTFTPTPEQELQSLRVDVKAESGAKQAYELALSRAPVSTTYVKAYNSRAGFRFGSSVAIDGDTVVVGAPSEDGAATGIDGDDSQGGYPDTGAVYVMVREPNGKWSRQAYIKPAELVKGALFGRAVSIAGNTIAVGAPGLMTANEYTGAVYIFVREGSTWSQQALLPGKATESGQLGSAVALNGDHLIASAPYSRLLGYEVGALYAYTRTGTTWKADVASPNPPSQEFSGYNWFGYRLGFSGDRVIASGGQLATVFVMLRSGTAWTVEQAINLPGGVLSKSSVAIDGDTLAVSAPGVVHVFTRSGSTWTKQASLTSFNENTTEGFGASLALKGDLLVVGSGCDKCQGGFSTFVRDGHTWKDGAYVPTQFIDAGDAHGAAVALSGTRIVVGGPGEDGNGKGFNPNGANNSFADAGAAYIYE